MIEFFLNLWFMCYFLLIRHMGHYLITPIISTYFVISILCPCDTSFICLFLGDHFCVKRYSNLIYAKTCRQFIREYTNHVRCRIRVIIQESPVISILVIVSCCLRHNKTLCFILPISFRKKNITTWIFNIVNRLIFNSNRDSSIATFVKYQFLDIRHLIENKHIVETFPFFSSIKDNIIVNSSILFCFDAG